MNEVNNSPEVRPNRPALNNIVKFNGPINLGDYKNGRVKSRAASGSPAQQYSSSDSVEKRM